VLVLVVALVVGLAAGYALRGRLTNLQSLQLRLPWLAVLAFAIQVLVFSPLGRHLGSSATVAVHLASYVLLIAFVAFNVHRAGILIAGLGLVANTVAIALNGGYMPAAHHALVVAGRLYPGSVENNSRIADATTHLRFLGDVFAVPDRVPLANVFSIGDILIALGVAVLIAAAMRGTQREV
jgi:hypothetical protein